MGSYRDNVQIPKKKSIAPSTEQTHGAFLETSVHLPCPDTRLNLLKNVKIHFET